MSTTPRRRYLLSRDYRAQSECTRESLYRMSLPEPTHVRVCPRDPARARTSRKRQQRPISRVQLDELSQWSQVSESVGYATRFIEAEGNICTRLVVSSLLVRRTRADMHDEDGGMQQTSIKQDGSVGVVVYQDSGCVPALCTPMPAWDLYWRRRCGASRERRRAWRRVGGLCTWRACPVLAVLLLAQSAVRPFTTHLLAFLYD